MNQDNRAVLSYKDEHTEITISEGYSDMNTDEFKTICMRMASAIGYHDINIQECFNEGEEYEEIVSKMRAEITELEERLDAKN
tara:strand:- start:11475 stop:11723 length:249 start_codon:yes stop_codon:yes gene_type:complete